MRYTLRLALPAAALVCAVLGAGCVTVAPTQTETAPATQPASRPMSLLIRMENGKSVTLDAARFQELPRETIKVVKQDGAEADGTFVKQPILVADQLNGGPLPEKAQPLQLIVPQDKRPSRWVRTLTKIEVRRVP